MLAAHRSGWFQCTSTTVTGALLIGARYRTDRVPHETDLGVPDRRAPAWPR